MIDGLRSSIALAQRTATKASETLASTTRQIATGQRVSSVKDDGAAWTQAVALKADAVTSSTKARMVEGVIALNQVPRITSVNASEGAARMKEILLQAIDAVGSSPEKRAQLAETWTQELLGYDAAQQAAFPQLSTDGVYWPNNESDAFGTWFKPFNGIQDMEDMRCGTLRCYILLLGRRIFNPARLQPCKPA
jgi:hypothetical protein